MKIFKVTDYDVFPGYTKPQIKKIQEIWTVGDIANCERNLYRCNSMKRSFATFGTLRFIFTIHQQTEKDAHRHLFRFIDNFICICILYFY